MKIQLAGTDCVAADCPHQRRCAQHTSAGDHRSEGGPTPDLLVENGKIYCQQTLRTDLHGYASQRPDGRLVVRGPDGEFEQLLHGDLGALRELLQQYEARPGRALQQQLLRETEALERRPLPPADEASLQRLARAAVSLARDPAEGMATLDALHLQPTRDGKQTWHAMVHGHPELTKRAELQLIVTAFDEQQMLLTTPERTYKVESIYPEEDVLELLDLLQETVRAGGQAPDLIPATAGIPDDGEDG